MISFNDLGNCGRIGNQMFQYSAIKGISKRHGYEFSIPPKNEFGKRDPKVLNEKCDIYDLFDLSDNIFLVTENKKVPEKSLNFDEELFNNCPDNVDLEGYFQSEKYFKHIENDIKNDFIFKDEIKSLSLNFLNNFSLTFETISLHIRRGDYLSFPSHHPICSIEYYTKALNEFSADLPVIIFTDDPEWCNSQNIFDDDRFFISENNDPAFDLCLMSLCKYHIIANSSFSWWGAWLSGSKKVIAPQKWFGAALTGWKIEDRVLEDWVLL
jgi:hypothetical protein